MLRAIPFKNAGRVQDYFTQALAKEDYWSKGALVAGLWHGKAATMLGLGGEVKGEDFRALSENRHPTTGEKITVRNNKERVIGMDFSFGVPKSVSLLFAFSGDAKITNLLQSANAKMMEAIERDAATQLWVKGQNQVRQVGNLAYATFLHHTSRPVGGIPDPHLHTHNFIMNLCYSEEMERFQALKFRVLKQNAPFYEAIGRSYLAKGLVDLGYTVKKYGKAFEIVGFPRILVSKYSRRTMEIEREIAERGIESAVAKAQVGALTRKSKSGGLSPEETLAAWTARLDQDEKKIIQDVLRNRGGNKVKAVTVEQSVDYALSHCFDKVSVAKMRDIFREAVAFGYGSLLPEEILNEIGKRNLITGKIRGVEHCTTPAVVSEERAVMAFVRRGNGRCLRLHPLPYETSRSFLSQEQQQAVREIIHSRNQVIGLQGAAGGGKTTLMQEVVEGIQSRGKKVFAFAPTVKAVDTLKSDGFRNASTLPSLLNSPEQQRAVKGQVVWVDEAGLVGIEDMLGLFRLAGSDTRVILTGDKSQHLPVSRGDCFRILQETGVLQCSTVKTIIRQEEGAYRDAAQALASGDLESAFNSLEEMGAFVEIENDYERYKDLAEKYVASLDEGESPILISPTHSEGRKVTKAVRERLRELKLIGKEQQAIQLQNQQWTNAQKTKAELYREGMVVEFHQNAKGGFVRGSKFTVEGVSDEGEVTVKPIKGKNRILNLEESRKFQVYRSQEIEVASGDQIKLTKGGFFNNGRRYKNGQSYRVSRVYPSGSIKLANGELLKKGFGHIAHGYVTTSHSAQSKTVSSPVFLAQSSEATGAGSLNQLYVSCTRGKNQLSIYTNELDKLKNAVTNSDFRISAIEFAKRQNNASMVSNGEENAGAFPYDVTEKERDIIFNKKGEFRHTTGYIRHEVGGSFEDYVAFRRQRYSNLTSNLEKERQAYLQGKKDGWEKAVKQQKEAKRKQLKNASSGRPKGKNVQGDFTVSQKESAKQNHRQKFQQSAQRGLAAKKDPAAIDINSSRNLTISGVAQEQERKTAKSKSKGKNKAQTKVPQKSPPKQVIVVKRVK